MRVGSQNKFCHFPPFLVHSAPAIVFISLSVCQWSSITILLLLVMVVDALTKRHGARGNVACLSSCVA